MAPAPREQFALSAAPARPARAARWYILLGPHRGATGRAENAGGMVRGRGEAV